MPSCTDGIFFLHLPRETMKDVTLGIFAVITTHPHQF